MNRLGNTDVSEKVAQQASCIAPKAFKLTLATVRNAIATYLTQRTEKATTPTSLARSYHLDDNVVYWVEQVGNALRQSGEAEELDVDQSSLNCVMFYWTCTALHVGLCPISLRCTY